MKKIYSFIFGCAALTLAASCTQELSFTQVEKPGEEANLVNITVIASEKPEVVSTSETKTFIEGSSVKWSDSGEKLKVFEVATPAEGDAVTTQATTSEGVTSDSGVTMSFGVSMADKSGGSYDSFDYYAIYPSSAYQTGSAVTGIALNTKGAQTPTATNFDASQDLLIAKKIENGANQASTLVMQFARVVAIGKMTIKNLESTDPITKITFSAKVGEEAVALAGRTNFNLETAKPVSAYASNTQDYAVILDYEGQNITANTSAGMVAYFTCYPFAINAETPGSFKVVVETATQSFTKEVNVSSAKGLAFNIGKASVFSVDMDGIAGETKEVDLRYAYLNSDDYANAGGGNSYSNITVHKTHGDSWETYARSEAGIQINSGYYIKLPDFAQDIKTVIVTLPVAASGKTLSLNTLANGSGTEIASLTTDSELSYEFDLSSDSYKTAYLISNGTIKFSKIEVYAGTDNRAALDAPQNVTASLNNDDAEVTNSIDVSWDAVDGAGSYLITLVDESLEVTTKAADASPFTVTGLAYDMEYAITVKAVPADAYVNTESTEADVPGTVTTGAEPAAAAYELVTSLANVTTGQYVITAHVGNKYYAMSNSFAKKIAGTEIAVVNNKISTSAADGYEVTITRVNNTVSIFNGSKYLVVVASGTDFTIQDSEDYNSISDGGNGGTFHISNTRGLIYRASTYNQFGNYSAANGTEYYDVELFKLADTREDAGMSWSAASASATIAAGGEVTFTAPTLTPGNATGITYDSTDEDVATISNTGVVTILAGGTTTIKAIFDGDANYKPAVATYTLTVTDNRVTYDFENIAELNALITSTSTDFSGYLTDAVVSYVPNTGNAIIKDATGSILVFKSGHGLKQGQTFTGEVNVTTKLYYTTAEVTELDAIFTGSETVVAPETVTLSQLIGNFDTFQNAYVQATDLTVTGVSSKNISVSNGGKTYVVYDNAGTSSVSAGDIITATGTVADHNGTNQIKVWSSDNIVVTGSAPKAITFSQPTGAAGAAGCSFTITVGGIPITSGDTVASGTTVTLTATAGTDYEFTSWTVTGASVANATSATTTFTMGSSPVTVSASFSSTGGGESEKIYTITWNSTNNSKGVSSYTGTWSVTVDGFTCDMSNFNNNNNGWNYVKCGNKSNASVATIITASAIPEAIRTVTLTIDALTASNINSIKLYSSSNKSSWTEEGSFTKAAGDQSVVIASPTANKYYKIEANCAKGSSNGLLTISKLTLATN